MLISWMFFDIGSPFWVFGSDSRTAVGTQAADSGVVGKGWLCGNKES